MIKNMDIDMLSSLHIDKKGPYKSKCELKRINEEHLQIISFLITSHLNLKLLILTTLNRRDGNQGFRSLHFSN